MLSGLSQHIVNFEEFLKGYNTVLVLGGDLTFNTKVRSWCKLNVFEREGSYHYGLPPLM